MRNRKYIKTTFNSFIYENIIAYHGTTDKGYKSYDYTYFTTDKEYAKKYAESTGRILKVDITINKPFIIEAKYMGYGEIILDNKIIGFYRDLKKDAVELLINAGYDGIIVNYEGKHGFEVIPFFENQVKELESTKIEVAKL
jgi:hypothetical protein